MEILPDLEWKYGLHPSVKGQKLTDTPGHRKVNYKAENVKLQISPVRSEEHTSELQSRE